MRYKSKTISEIDRGNLDIIKNEFKSSRYRQKRLRLNQSVLRTFIGSRKKKETLNAFAHIQRIHDEKCSNFKLSPIDAVLILLNIL